MRNFYHLFHLDNPSRAVSLMVLVTIQRGADILRFTNYKEQVDGWDAVSYENISWLPAPGAILTNIQYPSDGSPNTFDIVVAATPNGLFKPGDGALGRLEGWPITVELFDPERPSGSYSGSPPRFNLTPGFTVANVAEDSHCNITISAQGPLSKTLKPVTEHYALTGREDLGDDRCKVPIRPSDMKANTQYVTPGISTGLLRVDDAYARYRITNNGTVEDYQNLYWECTAYGTTGNVYSSLGGTRSPGSTITLGTASFIARNSWLRHARGQAVSNYNILLTELPDPRATDPTWFVMGGVFVCSGPLIGTRLMPIRGWDPANLIVSTFLPVAPADIPADTELEIYAGCDFTRETCFSRFNNIVNLRAETFVPPNNLVLG